MVGNDCRVIRFAVASCGSRRGDRRCCASGGRGIVCGRSWRREELSPTEVVGKRVVSPIEQFEIAGIAHRHAVDRGAWLLLAAAAIALSVRLPKYFNDWRRIGLALLGMVVCLLLAARWEREVAAASALRWFSAVFFVAAAAASWMIERGRRAPGYSGDTHSFCLRVSQSVDWICCRDLHRSCRVRRHIGIHALDAGCKHKPIVAMGLFVVRAHRRRCSRAYCGSFAESWQSDHKLHFVIARVGTAITVDRPHDGDCAAGRAVDVHRRAHACSSTARGSGPGKLVSPRWV